MDQANDAHGSPRQKPPPALSEHVLEAVTDALFVLDGDWRFIYVNGRALEYAREGLEGLLGRSLWQKYPRLLGTPLERHYRRAVAEQRPTHFEMPSILSGRWLEIHAYPWPGGLIVFSRDASDRKRVEEALRESEERHRIVADLTSDFVWTIRTRPEGAPALESVSEGFTRVTGYALEDLDRRGGWAALLHPDERERFEAVMPRVLSGERSVGEVRVVTAAGETRWLRYSTHPLRDGAGGPVVGVLGAAQDVTERRRAEEALRESRERFRAFMDNSPAVAFMKNEAGRFVYVNGEFRRRFGRGQEEVVGLTDFDVWPEDIARAFQEDDHATLEAGATKEFLETTPDPDGGTQSWRVFKFPFHDAAGRYVGGIAVNVTAQRRAEERLRRYARALLDAQEAERRRVACELHDEVGQLLTGLRLTLERGERIGGDGLAASVADAQGLVRDLTARVRDLSLRLRPSMLDDLGLLPALQWYVGRFGETTGVRAALGRGGLEGRLPPDVETAAYRIVQEALCNVARHAGVAECSVCASREGGVLRLEVEDRGRGFDAAAAGRGPSTGLSGMRERAALLGGTLTVDSAPGRGTRVVARLPISDASAGGAKPRKPRRKRKG